MTLDQTCGAINALVAKLEHGRIKNEQYKVAIGQHVRAIKAEHDDWEQIVRERCNLGRRSAYAYMAIADGKKTADENRRSNAAASKRLRDRKRASRDAQKGGADAADMPTEAEAEASYQETLYDQACLILKDMSRATRRRFFAHIKEEHHAEPADRLERDAAAQAEAA
jgi:hypothetical protein